MSRSQSAIHLVAAKREHYRLLQDGIVATVADRQRGSQRKVRNAFAHSTAIAELIDPSHQQRLAESYCQARANPLVQPMEQVVAQHKPCPDSALRDYILLITILVAFLEATAHQLTPIQAPVRLGFSERLRFK